MHETQYGVTDDGHHEMQVCGVYLALMSSLFFFVYSGFLMSSVIHGLINVFLIEVMRKIFTSLCPKIKIGPNNNICVNCAYIALLA